jgi:hypothetical protein
MMPVDLHGLCDERYSVYMGVENGPPTTVASGGARDAIFYEVAHCHTITETVFCSSVTRSALRNLAQCCPC